MAEAVIVDVMIPIVIALGLALGYDGGLEPATGTRSASCSESSGPQSLRRAPAATARPPGPSAAPAPTRVARGLASTYGPGFSGYLALPEGTGIRVRICGPAACVVRTSNDAGPDLAMQRAGRIVDLDVETFEAVSGDSWRMGLVRVTVEYLR